MEKDRDAVQSQIRRIKSLPTLPGVVEKICNMVESDKTSVAELAKIISTDQVLAAKLLKVVNSPFYGFPGRISTINHALVLLGFNVVKGIMISISVIDFMTDQVRGLWAHSVGVATAAGVIGRRLKLPEPEELSTAGLLHDLGKVIISLELRHDCDLILQRVESDGVLFIDAEREVLEGLTHTHVAGWLSEAWNLSSRLRVPIVRHHDLSLATDHREATAVVHLADILTRCLQFGSGGDPYVPALQPEALDLLELRLADLAGLLEEVDAELDRVDTSDFR